MILYDRERSKRNQEKRKEASKKYREEHKAMISEKGKKYYEQNKDQRKQYREQNKEHIQSVLKVYNQTEARIKGNKISNWKSAGMKHTPEEFDAIYERYCTTTECELCSRHVIIRCNNEHSSCVDHHHSTGCFRNIVCKKCNGMRRGQDMKHMDMLAEIHRRFV